MSEKPHAGDNPNLQDSQPKPPELAEPEAPLVENPAAAAPGETATGRTPAADGAQEIPCEDRGAMDLIWKVHGYTNEYIRFSDAKAGLILTYTSALIAGLYAAGLHHGFTTVAPVNWGWNGVLAASAFGLLILAAAIAAWSILPRLWSRQRIGFVFWESILAHGSADSFWTQLRGQSSEALVEHLAHHLFAIAGVCRRKYTLVSISLWIAGVGGLVGAGLLLVR